MYYKYGFALRGFVSQELPAGKYVYELKNQKKGTSPNVALNFYAAKKMPTITKK